jgi:anaerobic dimethyl sulfoxide reductase subunit A
MLRSMEMKIKGESGSTEKVVISVCASNCGGTCPLRVHVKDGVITAIEGDEEIRACLKGRSYRQRVYSPGRILYPLKRVGERGKGEFQRISWDEALDTVAAEIKRVRQSYGPAAVFHFGCQGDKGYLGFGRFLTEKMLSKTGGYSNWWGFPGPGRIASALTFGSSASTTGMDLLANMGDVFNYGLIIMWAVDTAATRAMKNACLYFTKARESGSRIVYIGPVYNNSAATLSDQWIPIRPGTDAAMLIAMAYVMINENLQDQAFLDKYTLGFDLFKEYVLGKEDGVPKTPAWAEDITGVPAATITSLAREYATTKPAAMLASGAAGRTAYGEQYLRAALTLTAMTGNIGNWGRNPANQGAREAPLQAGWTSLYLSESSTGKTSTGKRVDLDVYPSAGGELTKVNKNMVADAILKGKAGGYPADYKMLFVVSSDYVNQHCNINKIVQAMKKLEFIVVCEQVMNATAKFADIVLPVNTFLERDDVLAPSGSTFYGSRAKVINSLGESKSYFEIVTELAPRLGLDDFPGRTEEEWLRELIKGTKELPDYDEFRKKGYYKAKSARPVVAFEKEIRDPVNNPFPTASGKIEIYSQRIAEIGNPMFPPIPKYIEPWEGRNDPLAEKYPLQLITPHSLRRADSQFENIPWLKELYPQAVMINTVDAITRGIKDGGTVKVFNDRGVTVLTADVTERIMPGVVSIPQGAWYSPDESGVDRAGSVNVLTKDVVSPAGMWPVNSVLVQIEKV